MDFATLTAFLAPFLPYLVQAGRTVADEAGKAFGDEAWSHAQALWQRLWPKLGQKDAAKDAVEDVARQPADADARTVLKVQLEKLLGEDPALAAEIGQLWDAAKSANVVTLVTASGDRSIALGGDVGSGSTLITGDNATTG